MANAAANECAEDLPETLSALVCSQLERRLRAGEDCRAEEYLRRHPELADDPAEVVNLAYREFTVRESLGQRPSADDFARRFPEAGDGLAEQLRVHALLRDVIGAEDCVGKRIGQYEVAREIDRGSAGIVYQARDRRVNRTVALKVLAGLAAGPDEGRRFRTEGEAAARLHHPNIVELFEIGEDDGRRYLSMEYVAGGSLARRLDGRPWAAGRAAELVETLARAVAYAHAQGVLHRDLKPANVLLADDGTPKVSDFGLARILDGRAAQTQHGAAVGTPGYMAPEQAIGLAPAGPQADVYSLGAVLYELLAGRPPFRAETSLATLHLLLNEEPVPVERLQPRLPRDLAAICGRCLEADPRRRYPDAGSLAEDLRRFRAGEPVRARPVGALGRGLRWCRRRPLNAALAGVSILAAALLAGLGTWYNAKLRSALIESNAAKVEATTQRIEAQRQAAAARDELQAGRRRTYGLQLAQVADLWRSDPERAAAILDDPALCPADLRDFSWGLYRRLCRSDYSASVVHAGGIRSLVLSPEGSRLLAVGNDESVRICSIAGAPDAQAGYVFRPGRTVVAAGFLGRSSSALCADGRLRVWTDGPAPAAQVQRLTPARRAAVSSAAGLLAIADAAGEIALWRPGEAAPGLRLYCGGPVGAMAFSRDGSTLVAASADGELRVWGVTDICHPAEKPPACVTLVGTPSMVAVSADGRLAAVAGDKSVGVALVDLDAGRVLRTFRGHADLIRAADFSPDGRLLATAGDDQTVRIWTVAGGTAADLVLRQRRRLSAVVFSPDGRSVYSAGDEGLVHVRDVAARLPAGPEPDDPALGWEDRVISSAYSADGMTLATGRHDGTVRILDPRDGSERLRFPAHVGQVWSLALSPDGTRLATGGADGLLGLWDAATGRRLAMTDARGPRVRSVAFSPDGRLLATAADHPHVGIWDAATLEPVTAIETDLDEAATVAFHPSVPMLAIAGKGGIVELRTPQGELLGELAGVDGRMVTLAFSPDGNTLAAAGLDTSLYLWDVPTRQVRARLAWTAGYVFSAAFTPDGRSFVAGGGSRAQAHTLGEVRIWDTASGDCRAVLVGESGPVAFSPDGTSLAAVAGRSVIRFWRSEVPARAEAPGASSAASERVSR